MIKKSFSKIAIGCFLVFSMASCGKSNPGNPGPGGGGGSGGPTGPRGAAFFNDKRSAQTLRTERQTFLDTNIMQVGPLIYNLTLPRLENGDSVDVPNNNLRNSNNANIPLTPLIHLYGFPTAIAPLVASLPLSFLPNIPQEIENTIRQYDIDHLDIFFVAQEGIPGTTVPLLSPLPEAVPGAEADWLALRGPSSLKPAFWVDPHMPYLGTIGVGRWNEHLPMAIYQPSDPTVEDQVRINQLQLFPISVHHGSVSGDTGHLRLVQGQNYSFWSLVISPILAAVDPTLPGGSQILRAIPDRYKAAVTLHWIMTPGNRSAAFRGAIQTTPSTLRNVITTLDGQINGLFATNPAATPLNPNRHLLEQLKLLVRE